MEEAEQMAAEEPVQVTKEEADRMAKDLADMASKVLTFARGGRAEAMEQARVEEAERIEVLGKGEEEAEPAKKEEAEQSKHPSLPITDSKIAQAAYIRLRQRLEDAQLRGFLDFSGPPTEKPVPVEGEVQTEGEEVDHKDEGEDEPTELLVPLGSGVESSAPEQASPAGQASTQANKA